MIATSQITPKPLRERLESIDALRGMGSTLYIALSSGTHPPTQSICTAVGKLLCANRRYRGDVFLHSECLLSVLIHAVPQTRTPAHRALLPATNF